MRSKWHEHNRDTPMKFHDTIACADKKLFKRHCKEFVMKKFVNMWQQELTTQTKPILRTYSLFKNDFFIEHHLESITDFRYRTAITKLRCSSHALEIERGRYQNPKVPRDLRLCLVCQVVEDEEHFVTNCSINQAERRLLYSKISCKVPCFSTLSDFDNFCTYWQITILRSLPGLENLFTNPL